MRAPRIDDQQTGLRPPQFGLQTLLAFMALLGLLLAALNSLGEYATLWIVIFLLAVAAHIAGNAIGTRLREIGDVPESGARQRFAFGKSRAVDFAPATKLRERAPLGRWIFVVAGLGGVAGVAFGLWWVAKLGWDRVTIPTVICAAIACGVFGGLLSFLVSSFIKVAGGAAWQSLRHK